MKNNMRTLITGLFALTLMFGFSLNANAQAGQTDTDVVNVSATVLVDIKVEQKADLAFGNVAAQSSPKADPTGVSDPIFTNTVGGLQSIGKFQVTGAAGAAVLVSWDAALPLLSTSGVTGDGDAINFVPELSFEAGDNQTDAFGGAVQGTGTGTVSFAYNIFNTAGGVGTDTFWVGGSLHAKGATSGNIQAAAQGGYAADLTITAAYN